MEREGGRGETGRGRWRGWEGGREEEERQGGVDGEGGREGGRKRRDREGGRGETEGRGWEGGREQGSELESEIFLPAAFCPLPSGKQMGMCISVCSDTAERHKSIRIISMAVTAHLPQQVCSI